MRIGIVGWGLEAQSAYRFFGPDHEYLIVNESAQDDFPPQSDRVKVQFLNNHPPVGIPGQVEDLSYLEGIEGCDKIVYQPTAYFNLHNKFGDDRGFWSKATTVYDIFYDNCPTTNIIGITGTKGKGTTSTLIAKMLGATLRQSSGPLPGQRVHLGGNIGTPILDLLPDIKSDDWLVWELANFQLKTASYSPHIALCLMITPEHLDWHPNIEDYIDAKANIFRHQKPDDIAIYFANNHYSQQIAGYSAGIKIPYFASPGARIREDGMIVVGQNETETIKTNQLKLIGRHNWQNVCAALTGVWAALGEDQAKTDQNVTAIRGVLGSFVGLEHRLEFVRRLDFVDYYDDSFGTTPDTTTVAIQAFAQPAVLVLGGHDKGAPFDDLINEIAGRDRVRHVIAIGDTGPKLAAMLRDKGYQAITEGLSDMPAMVAEARAKAQPGDVVLLSTGCSSFGLFADYKDRGNQFKEAVRALV